MAQASPPANEGGIVSVAQRVAQQHVPKGGVRRLQRVQAPMWKPPFTDSLWPVM